MKVTLIQATPNPIETITQIASICYDSDPKNPPELMRHLYRNGHHSVFEHVYFTFKIEGISRACSHQLVRHRHCSFTQRSQRYCSESGFGFVTPPAVDEKAFAYAIGDIRDWYEGSLQAKEPIEGARYLLPNACETSLYLSCNLRELIHISNERLCSRAQWEIRELVKQMVSLVAPELHYMLVPKCKSGRIICNDPCNKQPEECIMNNNAYVRNQDIKPVCTNNEARNYFKNKGLTYDDITQGDILTLAMLLNKELKKAAKKHETSVPSMYVGQKIDIKKKTNGSIVTCFLYVDSHYFTRRECISFNPDGFISFAEWADQMDLNPILRAFLQWCDAMEANKNA